MKRKKKVVSKLAKSLMTKKSDQALKLDWEKIGPTKGLNQVVKSAGYVETDLEKIKVLTNTRSLSNLNFKVANLIDEKLLILINRIK